MGGKSKDLYAVLELPKTCTSAEIRTAYKRLVMVWHPDKYVGNDPEKAKRRFQEIQQAYDVLSDPGRRLLYDAGYQDEAKEEDDMNYGMGDFLKEMTTMMNQVQEENDSFEDLRATFMSMFNTDTTCSNINSSFTEDSKQQHMYMSNFMSSTTFGSEGIDTTDQAFSSLFELFDDNQGSSKGLHSGKRRQRSIGGGSTQSRKSTKARNDSSTACNIFESLNSASINFPGALF